MKTVLITGVAGFLGRHAARQFEKSGWRVVGVDTVPAEHAPLGPGTLYHRIQLPSAGLTELLRALPPEAVIHCAGQSAEAAAEDPAADFRRHPVLTFELLESIRTAAPGARFLLLSTSAVYGHPASQPVAENHRTAPLTPLGFHKLQCELLCEEFTRLHGLRTTIARIFTPYGRGLRQHPFAHICERAASGAEITLPGTGREAHDLIEAADVARALVLLAEQGGTSAEVYNVASGTETAMATIADLLLSALLSPVRVQFDGSAVQAPPSCRADISKLAALGFTPTVPLETGLRRYAASCFEEIHVP